ncbi:FkbM family methyltransferase [Hoyosella sp. G463]|uniref:FkbM family methyltransferase n=1 Tax=Lolliginicoccus lacisalsi TaxID=2742202 RepID=A0A927PMP2_9ACTN|nr:FkbM family methyltransferase [Lolliginicoccus lacisalsi]MBD8506857.1 FkbM family methyltransferase [Lolliginicoccus lacisalsi]
MLEDAATSKARKHRRLSALSGALLTASKRISSIEPEIRGLRCLVERGDTCIDVGAEYGLYTWTLSSLVGDRGHVHSVEPQRALASTLEWTSRMLGCANVVVHNAALHSHHGQGTLSVPVRRGFAVHGRAYLDQDALGPGPNREFARSRTIKVPITTIDAIAAACPGQQISFIKADVEGAEIGVLKGASQTIARDHPAILLEIESRHLAKYGATSADLLSMMSALGYRPYLWIGEGWIPSESKAGDMPRNQLFLHESNRRPLGPT